MHPRALIRHAPRSLGLVVGLLGIAGVLGGCGSAVPVSGSVATPTPSCSTPGPASQKDSFNEQVTLTTKQDGLQLGDLRVGCGAVVKVGSTATVQYSGWLANGTLFDSSRKPGRQPFSYPAGQQQVIPGFDEGVLGMHVGGKRRLVLPPALAYGTQGRPPVIPGNATLIFDVEVIAVG